MPKENMYYTCITCITIGYISRIYKKNHPQVCLKECKYKIKKKQMLIFTKTELKSNSDSNLHSDLEKMEAKIDNELEPAFDSE